MVAAKSVEVVSQRVVIHMTDEQSRIGRLEDRYHSVDSRQESFETFVKAYIDNSNRRMEQIEARMDRHEVRMDRLEDKLDGLRTDLTNQIRNLLIAGGIGIATIVVAIALK